MVKLTGNSGSTRFGFWFMACILLARAMEIINILFSCNVCDYGGYEVANLLESLYFNSYSNVEVRKEVGLLSIKKRREVVSLM